MTKSECDISKPFFPSREVKKDDNDALEAKDKRIAELEKANAELNHKIGEYVDKTARKDAEIVGLRNAVHQYGDEAQDALAKVERLRADLKHAGTVIAENGRLQAKQHKENERLRDDLRKAQAALEAKDKRIAELEVMLDQQALGPTLAKWQGVRTDNERLRAVLEKYEDRLFALGEMKKAPCFCCGYNGPNYYQPNVHKCAKRHHEAFDNTRSKYKNALEELDDE